MLIGWAHRSLGRTPSISRESAEDIADYALARAWSALTPTNFDRFPSLSALLTYLRSCISATVIDIARAEGSRERVVQRLENPPISDPEQLILDEASRSELWQLIGSMVQSEQERIILTETFLLGLPVRTILARHPDMFEDVGTIYAIKRNLVNRLQRSSELRRLYTDLSA